MKIFSYTDQHFGVPPEYLSGKEWPVQFHEGYSRFYHEFYQGDILLVHDSETNAWLPFHRILNRLARFGQILHPPVVNAEELNAASQEKYMNKLMSLLHDQVLIHRFVQPHPSGMMQAAPVGSKAIRFGTYITDLTEYTDNEKLLYSFDPKYRKAVQHSIKNDAKIVFGPCAYDDFYKLYCMTAQRTGMYKDPAAYFQLLRHHLGDKHTETGVVYDGDQPIGGIFMVYSDYAAFCTHAGSGGESKLYGGMKHLHYEMMKLLRDRGVKKYDLVGVRIGGHNPALEGVFRFKRGFGGLLKEGYLWKADIDGLHLKLYDMMSKLKNPNLKPDIIDQESEE
jgi:FemAB family